MIRQVTRTDFLELADIYYGASLIAHPFIHPAFVGKNKQRVRDEHLPLNESFVYEQHGGILGFIFLS